MGKEAHLGFDGLVVLGVSLDDKVEDRLLVLVLKETEEEKGRRRVVLLEDVAGNVLDVNLDVGSNLQKRRYSERTQCCVLTLEEIIQY